MNKSSISDISQHLKTVTSIVILSSLVACGGESSDSEDTTAPVITLIGDQDVRVLINDTFTDLGANANDDIDGIVAVTTSGTVDTSTKGVYTLTYTAIDTSGNEATLTRSILVDEPKPFITTWKTNNPGETADHQVKIQTHADTAYNYTVNWGDGNTDENVSSDITHDYAVEGTYTITISKDFPRIYFSGSECYKLLTVEQWGETLWTSMANAFEDCNSLQINTVDTPNLKDVTTMNAAFHNAREFNGDLSNWDVSSVTDMNYMFQEASIFTGDLSSWDVSNVESMDSLFNRASAFNADISNWNVSKVTNMDYMFLDATAFNKDLSKWDVSSVTKMLEMFDNSSLSTTNYDSLLIGWSQQQLQSNVSLGASSTQYTSAAAAARNTLASTFNWTITDSGQQP